MIAEKPGSKDLVADELVGVGDISNLEVGDERKAGFFKVSRDGEAGREYERVTDLDRIEVRGAGMSDLKCPLLFRHVKGKDKFRHGTTAPSRPQQGSAA